MKNIGVVVLATNAYFVLGIRFVKRFITYYKGSENITFYFFSDKNPKDYLQSGVDFEYFHVENNNWVDGTNMKFTSILSIGDKLRSDYLFYFDADTNVNNKFDEHWFLGGENMMVGGQHYADQDWMKEKKNFDRNPQSMAYIPENTNLPQMYYYGAFFGGSSQQVIQFCQTMVEWQKKDKMIGYEPAVNDESYINKYFHYNPPYTVKCEDFKFAVSDKGGIGETRNPNLDVSKIMEFLLSHKEGHINIAMGMAYNSMT